MPQALVGLGVKDNAEAANRVMDIAGLPKDDVPTHHEASQLHFGCFLRVQGLHNPAPADDRDPVAGGSGDRAAAAQA